MSKKLLKLNVVKETKIDQLDNFGEVRDHYLFLASSDDLPICFANLMSRLFGSDFSFLENYAPSVKKPGRSFPVFASEIQKSREVKLAIMANKMPVPSEEQAIDHPLLGFSMFDEYYYFFNKSEHPLFECPYEGYDFLLLLSCIKNGDISDVVETISQVGKVRLKDISHYLREDEKMPVSVKESRLVKSMFVHIDIAMQEMGQQRIYDKLWDVRSIPPENYPYGFLYGSPILNGPMLEREDI